jgi:hypothetical protein
MVAGNSDFCGDFSDMMNGCCNAAMGGEDLQKPELEVGNGD